MTGLAEARSPRPLGPGVRVRRATRADLDALLAIKRNLPMPRASETRSGGFLLGSDRDNYARLLEFARVWLLEVEGETVGFCVTLEDPVLRASPLWERRASIEWREGFDPDAQLERRIAYFDQLAVRPPRRHRYWGVALALRALAELFAETEHELVLTTTVVEPILNRAALPYLARVGAREVGRIDEHYPGVGAVVSAIHLIEAERCRERLETLAAPGPGRGATRRLIESSWSPWVL